jgi:hypothetical protein
VVEPLAILVDIVEALFQMQKLLKLASHEARGDVVLMKSLPKLSPRNLVALSKSGGVVSPPGTSGPMKLLGHIQSLLELHIVHEPNLGLDDKKPVIPPQVVQMPWRTSKGASPRSRCRMSPTPAGGAADILLSAPCSPSAPT